MWYHAQPSVESLQIKNKQKLIENPLHYKNNWNVEVDMLYVLYQQSTYELQLVP